MATDQEHAREIAERIARRVSANQGSTAPTRPGSNVSSELASVRAVLTDLERKLSDIERKISSAPENPAPAQRPVPLTHSPWLAGVNASAHPSHERFGVEEATVSELVDFFEREKTCTVEPGGKPCDHCAMCSSRGF